MSTPLVVVSQSPDTDLGAAIPSDPAGYSGSGATKLVGGPASGSAQFFVNVSPIDTTSAANIIRVFKKGTTGTKFPQGEYDFKSRIKNPDNPAWRQPLRIGPITLSSPNEEIHISQEKNDNATKVLCWAEQFNLG